MRPFEPNPDTGVYLNTQTWRFELWRSCRCISWCSNLSVDLPAFQRWLSPFLSLKDLAAGLSPMTVPEIKQPDTMVDEKTEDQTVTGLYGPYGYSVFIGEHLEHSVEFVLPHVPAGTDTASLDDRSRERCWATVHEVCVRTGYKAGTVGRADDAWVCNPKLPHENLRSKMAAGQGRSPTPDDWPKPWVNTLDPRGKSPYIWSSALRDDLSRNPSILGFLELKDDRKGEDKT